MFLQTLLVCFALLGLGVHARVVPEGGRIVNGTDALPGEIPYIVSLRLNGSHICGGSILDKLHVLTAAHCVQDGDATFLSVQYGVLNISLDDQIVKVEKVFRHKKYNGFTIINDVAVLKLESPLPIGANVHYVQPVVLPEQDEQPPANEGAVLAGWGDPYSGGRAINLLQRVDLLVYSDEDCKAAHGNMVNSVYNVCAGVPEGGKGQCRGDSGGPLYSNGKQHGIVSWSIKPCAAKGFPGVFTRVSNYINWINEKRELS